PARRGPGSPVSAAEGKAAADHADVDRAPRQSLPVPRPEVDREGPRTPTCLSELGEQVPRPERVFERGAEEAEVADARHADVLWRDALHAAGRSRVVAMHRFGAA